MFAAYIFLRPFGLASPYAVYARSSELDRIKSQLGSEGSTVYTTRDIEKEKMPFLLSQAAVFAPGTGTDLERNPLKVYPYEHTPLYSGIPLSYTGEDAGDYGALGDLLLEP